MFNSSNGNGFSLSDIAAVLKGNGDGDNFFGGNGISAIILLIIIMGFFGGWNNGGYGNGFGGGNSGGAVPYVVNTSTNTDNTIERGFDNLTVNNKLDNITSDISSGMAGVNMGVQSGFMNLATSLCSSFDGVTAGINNLGYNLQNNLLQVSNLVDGVKYENAANTNAIIQAGNANTQRLMDMINQNTVQQLRDDLQNAQFENSQTKQTSDIIATLLPTPRPSYVVASPYQSMIMPLGGFPPLN